jgi:hypothetical protein
MAIGRAYHGLRFHKSAVGKPSSEVSIDASAVGRPSSEASIDARICCKLNVSGVKGVPPESRCRTPATSASFEKQ